MRSNVIEAQNYVGSEEATRALAKRIREYWKAEGYVVTTRIDFVTRTGVRDAGSLWCIRSDMINGMPVRSLT